jgi:hypothetical protein
MSSKLISQEAVMGQVIPRQHPAVVLKSHYKAVRALLAAALIAVVALAAAVVILANDSDKTASTAPISHEAQNLPQGTRFDGGPDEGTRGISTGAALPPGTRFDGGPDEGTRGIQTQSQSYWQQAGARTSYQPPAGLRFKERAGGPRFLPMGPSPR